MITLLWSYVNDNESVSFHVEEDNHDTNVTVDSGTIYDLIAKEVNEFEVMQDHKHIPMIYIDEYLLDVAIIDDNDTRRFIRLDLTDIVFKLADEQLRQTAPWGSEYD